ncbi:MAG: ABC transporter substrate-binding protein [Candidatus Tectomicrobia bacterium]|nr:ABC transporter substrate-binding protein [Candidatus Tectomicrobia bacterium]
MIRFPRMRIRLLVLLSGFLVATSVPAEPVKLTVLLPFSNVLKHNGISAKNGFLLGINQEASDRNVQWKTWVTFEFLDTRSDKTYSLQLAREAMVNGSKAFLGFMSSGVTLHLRDYILDEAKVPFIVFGAGNASTVRRQHPLFLRLTNDTQYYSLPLALWLKKHPIVPAPKPRWVCIYADYNWGVSICDGFKRAYQNVGVEIGRVPVPFKTVDKKKELVQLTKLEPDFALGVFGGGEAQVFMRDYFRFKVHEKIPLITPGSAFTSGLLLTYAKTLKKYDTGVGVLNAHVYSSMLDNKANQNFVKLYQEVHHTVPNIYAMRGYDAGRLLIKALTKLEGKWDGVRVVEQMKTLPVISPRHGEQLQFDSHGDAINPGYLFMTKRQDDQLVNELIGQVPSMRVIDSQ